MTQPTQRRWHTAIVSVVLITSIGACGGGDDSIAVAARVDPVRWSDCDLGFECGTVTVPVDYNHANAGTLQVAVVRKPAGDAQHRIGSLVLNPGGPGLSGVSTLKFLSGAFPAAVRERFDLVSFDPRGTGASMKIDCGTDLSALVSAAPVAATDGAPLPVAPLYVEMGKACTRAAGHLLPFVHTVNTARDLDRIRQALGDDRLTYLGVSYGTRLGSVYADLFPGRVRAAVLDGAIDPTAPLDEQAREQAQAAEAALGRFLDACKAAHCQIGLDPAAFYDALQAQLARQPLPAPGFGDNHPVTAGDLQAATLAAISLPTFYGPQYLDALSAAGRGNGAPLRELARGLFSDPDGPSEFDAYWTILCADERERPSALDAGSLARELAQHSPRVGAYSASYLVAGCADWPLPPKPIPLVRAKGAPPIVVIGTTGDPNTPYPWARNLANALASAVVVTREGEGHTWFASGFRNKCVNDLVAAYFIDLAVPLDGTTCTASGTRVP